MPEARTIGISISLPWRDLYDVIWRPECFPKWASGLSKSSLEQEGDIWTTEGPQGPIRIRFTDYNPFGVMDHYVCMEGGSEIYIPLRIISNGDGAEAMLTLFRQPGMSDAKFIADVEWVERDLLALRTIVMR